MERALNGFIRALRLAGVEASTAEAIDAARTLALVGYDDREALRASFGVVLAKSETEKSIHDTVFDQYFARPAEPAGKSQETEAEENSSAGDSPETGDPEIDGLLGMAAGGGGDGGGSDATRAQINRAATEAGADEIRFQSQTSYYVARTMDRLGIGALEARLIELLNRNRPEAQAEAQILADARDRLRRMVRAAIDRRYELYGRPATEQFMTDVAVNKAMAQIGTSDLPRMKAAVARMAKRLAVKHSRRQRIKLNGQLDVRRTLRANAGRDSVPFDLVFRYKRRDKPRIVAVCDVSGSVSAHARFLLLFLHTLHHAVTDLATFVFSNTLHDVEDLLERLPFEQAMAQILRDYGGGGTDYGAAFAKLEDEYWDDIDKRTTVLMLGDGRSNYTPARIELFREMADRAKRIVWLATEAPGRWGTGDSYMLKYLPYCAQVSHCVTVADLERAVDEVLEAY
ncbi:MAG: VWA domain-containing protein [Hyphomicrobiales bacterium]|nr:MAG: VWA domain-containing protein [Hyphomicrobiales bacterium]